MATDNLMKVELLQNAPFGPFGAVCNTFDLHWAIIGLFESGRFTQVLQNVL